jgi:hypothetical protein
MVEGVDSMNTKEVLDYCESEAGLTPEMEDGRPYGEYDPESYEQMVREWEDGQ